MRRQIMSLNRFPISRIIVALTVLALPFAAFAADNVGKASGGGNTIQWQLKVTGHDRVEMAVLAPNGTRWVKSFSAGKTPSISLSDLGTDVEDGQYNYELLAVPNFPANVKKQLAVVLAVFD